jgi:hypothetical protein
MFINQNKWTINLFHRYSQNDLKNNWITEQHCWFFWETPCCILAMPPYRLLPYTALCTQNAVELHCCYTTEQEHHIIKVYSYTPTQALQLLSSYAGNLLHVICICMLQVCKSVHHHTFNWINQPDAANSQVYYLSFKYSSTFFYYSS